MSFTNAEGRRQLLDEVSGAVSELGLAIRCLSEAYEALDEDTGDRLEEQIFRPVQGAYGRLRRTGSEFSERYGLDGAAAEAAYDVGVHDPRTYIERALDAVQSADQRIAELQDSMLPVDVGDPEVRAGLSDTRSLIADVPARGRLILRTLGR